MFLEDKVRCQPPGRSRIYPSQFIFNQQRAGYRRAVRIQYLNYKLCRFYDVEQHRGLAPEANVLRALPYAEIQFDLFSARVF